MCAKERESKGSQPDDLGPPLDPYPKQCRRTPLMCACVRVCVALFVCVRVREPPSAPKLGGGGGACARNTEKYVARVGRRSIKERV